MVVGQDDAGLVCNAGRLQPLRQVFQRILQLQIAGIMSEAPLIEVNEALENAKEQAFKLGVSRGVDPFMTLSFMALTVIPTLRLTTRGVFDVINQRYV